MLDPPLEFGGVRPQAPNSLRSLEGPPQCGALRTYHDTRDRVRARRLLRLGLCFLDDGDALAPDVPERDPDAHHGHAGEDEDHAADLAAGIVALLALEDALLPLAIDGDTAIPRAVERASGDDGNAAQGHAQDASYHHRGVVALLRHRRWAAGGRVAGVIIRR